MTDFITDKTLTPAEEARYINDWLPLVHKIVKQLSWQASSVMDSDDMEQVALMGLLTALRRYGHPNEQFAAYAGQRIRGAILDELRELDWRPRRLRQKNHQMNDAIRELARKLGKEPTFDDIHKHLSISAEDYHAYLKMESARALQSLDELMSLPTGGTLLSDAVKSRALQDELVIARTLHQALSHLDEREQIIVSLYYQHDMSLKEIALVLGVSEARVCQLNKSIALKINKFFKEA